MDTFSWLGVHLVNSHKGGLMIQPSSDSSLVVDVKGKQHLDLILMKLKDFILGKSVEIFSQGGYGVLKYQGRLCVQDGEDLRRNILDEAHALRYSIHPAATKMYRGLQEVYCG